MDRPTVTKEMRLAAAAKVAERISANAEDIADAHMWGMDGYELARTLEDDYGWDRPTTMVVDELDCMDSLVRRELEAAEKKWAAENQIAPPLPIGTQIAQGVIDGVSEYSAARYLVKENGCTDPGRHLLVKFEDAVAV